MTDKQIKQNAEAYADSMIEIHGELEWCATRDDFIAGAHSMLEEIEELELSLEAAADVVKILTKQLNELDSPWISVEERLPEIEDEKEKRTGEVFVCIKDGVYLVAHYSYFYKAWYAFDDRGGCMYRKIRTPRYWMPIPELEKGK